MMRDITIVFGDTFLDNKTLTRPTHRVTSLSVDDQTLEVLISMQKGLTVEHIKMTMSEAQGIGLINLDALKTFCK